MKEIKVRLKKHGYPVMVGRGIIRRLGKTLKRLKFSPRLMIVTDRRVASLYLPMVRRILEREGFKIFAHDSLPANESAKSEKVLFGIYSHLVSAGLDRNSSLIALGGGIVGDVTGFAASTYMRGIPWAVLPTTLLAQIDSAVGGKTAINLPQGKNLVGTFYQPKLVLSDIHFLKTLPDRAFRSSLAELIKYAVIWSGSFFSFLERHLPRILKRDPELLEEMVAECVRIKKTVVEQDEREEKGVRVILNYGHTFAHAFEAAGEAWSSSIPHGEAVAVGMAAAAELARRQGLFSPKAQNRQSELIRRAGLPVKLRKGLSVSRILQCMYSDKKVKEGRLRFILPVAIGKVRVFSDIPLRDIRRVLEGVLK